MSSTLHLNEFFVEGENQELSHVLLHIIQPSTPEEEKDKGYFFAACEINNGDKEDVVNLQALMDKIENDYYEIPNVAGKETLESILENINNENFSLGNPEGELSCLIGALRGQELIFSFCGRPEAILFYKNKSGQYQKMDLIAANEDTGEEDKLFSQIIQGKISQDDYFFGGTAHIANCFNHDRLQKIITGRKTDQSAEHFEKVLSSLRSGYSYGGLVVHYEPEPVAAAVEKPKEAVEKQSLFHTEQQTARTLSPSLFDSLSSKGKIINSDEEEIETPEHTPQTPAQLPTAAVHLKQRPVRPETPSSGAAFVSVLKIIGKGFKLIGLGIYWIFFFLAKLVINVGRFFVMLFIIAFNFKNRRRVILEAFGDSWRRFWRSMKELPLITKILAVAAIIFGIVFISSIFYLQAEKRQTETNRIYQESLQTIKNKTDAAESAAIFGDDNSAKNQIAEARSLLASFTCEPADKASCDEINNRLTVLSLKLRKMDTVAASLIVDFSQSGFTFVNKILRVDNKIIGFSANTSSVVVYDLMTKETKLAIITDTSISGFTNGAVPKENDYLALIAADNKTIELFDPATNSFTKAEISYSTTAADIKAITIYNRRLYSLDASSNQIYRHDNIKGGFGLGKDWLKDTSLNVRDGVKMAIDGDLYILKSNGEMLRYNQGTPVPIGVEIVDPVLDSANDIWTYTDVEHYYVLDAKNKRVITFDKTGKFVRQQTATEFSAPSAFVINEAKGTAYVFDQNKIYEIKIK